MKCKQTTQDCCHSDKDVNNPTESIQLDKDVEKRFDDFYFECEFILYAHEEDRIKHFLAQELYQAKEEGKREVLEKLRIPMMELQLSIANFNYLGNPEHDNKLKRLGKSANNISDRIKNLL